MLAACAVRDPIELPLEGRPVWMDSDEGQLYASREPLLGENRSENVEPETMDIVRLTIGHALRCDYEIIRVVKVGDAYTLVSKILDGCVPRFPAPGRVNVRSVERTEWDNLVSLLVESGFWTAPTWADRMREERAQYDECKRTSESCEIIVRLDGSMWTVEALIGGQYRLVDEWSPDSGVVFDLAAQLAAMARINLH